MSETLIREPAKTILTKEEFLARIATKTKTVSYPNFGDVILKSISAEERDEIQAASTDMRTGKTREAVLAAVTLVKGMVEPKMTPAEVETLKKSDFTLVMKISNDIWALSGGLDALKKD